MVFLSRNYSRGERIFGIDLSDSSAKVFQVERKGKTDRIRSFFSAPFPRGSFEDGRVVEKEKVVAVIREAIKKSGPKKINTKKAVCSLPESKAFIRLVSIPKMKEEEASEAVKWEIEASIPLSVDQVYYDWQFVAQEDGKQTVLTVAVAKDVVDETIEVLEAAGVFVCGLEVESVANVRSLIPNEVEDCRNFMIVDIGEKRTSFIVTEKCVPYFTSSIPFSSDGLTDAISKSLMVNFEEAEKIKIKHGIEHSLKNNSIFLAVRPLLESLAIEIEKTIDFYQNMSKKSSKIESIIICGGGANLKGLLPYLTTRLAREVCVGNPWVNLNLGNQIPIISRDESVSFSTVVGLAIKKVDYGN